MSDHPDDDGGRALGTEARVEDDHGAVVKDDFIVIAHDTTA
jgi:hypothetical protein